MAEEEPTEADEEKKSIKYLIISFIFVLLGSAGGFYAGWSGTILAGTESKAIAHNEAPAQKNTRPQVAFVAIDPLTISLRNAGPPKHLRFRAQLEVPTEKAEDVQFLLPRVVDILNGYLRALEPSDIEDAAALSRIRAQMLRRIQIVTGEQNVNSLLIVEFVIT